MESSGPGGPWDVIVQGLKNLRNYPQLSFALTVAVLMVVAAWLGQTTVALLMLAVMIVGYAAAEIHERTQIRADLKQRIDEQTDAIPKATLEAVQAHMAYDRVPDGPATTESTLYDLKTGDPFDFDPQAVEGAAGKVSVDGGVLSIERGNTQGRYFVWLRHYDYEGRRLSAMPKSAAGDAERKLHLACEARALGGEHTLVFVWKAKAAPPGQYLAEWRERITRKEWMPINAYFRVTSSEDASLRLIDRSVSNPSTLEIRNLRLMQRRQ